MSCREKPVNVSDPGQGHHTTMTQVGITITIFAEEVEHRGQRFAAAELAQSQSSKETNSRGGIAQQREQTVIGFEKPLLAQHLC